MPCREGSDGGKGGRRKGGDHFRTLRGKKCGVLESDREQWRSESG